MNVAVIGTGYVGLTTAVSLSVQGHLVTSLDIDQEKIDQLKRGNVPIYEPGLELCLATALSDGQIRFTTEMAEAVKEAEVIFVCVGTPADEDGSANLSSLYDAVQGLRECIPVLPQERVLAIKSTVPVGTSDQIADRFIERKDIHVVANPEFLREGSALQDSLEPSRIVIGAEGDYAFEVMKRLYHSLSVPWVRTSRANAEMIKYASNAFLATRISFMNELARLCAVKDLDISVVARGMGLDGRIGPDFLRAGLGFGGSCFPKDTAALLQLALESGVQLTLIDSVRKINASQPEWFLAKMRAKLRSLRSKRIAVLGLSFKPETDDVREAPSLSVLSMLLAEEARVFAYDPIAIPHMKPLFPKVTFVESPYEAMAMADAAMLVTEWKECTQLDWQKVRNEMNAPYLFDGRNAWPMNELRELGFDYTGVGRG